jgi:hypothetical protein
LRASKPFLMASCTEGETGGVGKEVVGEGVSKMGELVTSEGVLGTGGGTMARTTKSIVTTNAVAANKGNGCPNQKGELVTTGGTLSGWVDAFSFACLNRSLPNLAGS